MEINRRQFLWTAAAGTATAQQRLAEDSAIAGATVDTTPRVGIVLSSFRGSSDHDGGKLPGLQDPRPPDADLTTAQLDAMVVKAIELGNQRGGGLETVVEADDWVVLKPDIGTCYGLPAGGSHHRYIPGSVTDPRLVRSVISFLVRNKRGSRFTIAEGSAEWLPRQRAKTPVDGWTTTWGDAYGGFSYQQMVSDFSTRYPHLRFDLVDLNFDESSEEQVRGKAAAARNPSASYRIPKTITRCDRLIGIAPMKTDIATTVSLSVKNYFGIAPGAVYGFPKDGLHKLGQQDELMADLFSIRPADYAIVGGCWGVDGDGPHAPGGKSVHHNLILAGHNAVAVDAVAAAAMGMEPKDLVFLRILEKKGLGTFDLDAIWMRGSDLSEAAHPFRKPNRKMH